MYIKIVIITDLKGGFMLKYSRQRESIKNYLMTRTDHPTAEKIYENVRKEYPKISLGTVYRNLALLTEIGEIQTISTGIGPDRFDGNAAQHYHFICKTCGSVVDLKLQGLEHINLLAQHDFRGVVEGHTAFFYGQCEPCMKSVKSTENTKIEKIDKEN